MDWVAGVDGCPAGWIVALARLDGAAEPRIAVVPTFADVLAAAPSCAAIAVDMPIGLPERIGPGGRGPERALRPLLGARQSSVFAVPSRRAVFEADYRAACAAALATSDPPRMVSKQCYFLFPKIREVDTALRADPTLPARLFESHPEGVFMMLNGGPLAHPKKVKSRPFAEGLAERRALLARAGLPPGLLAAPPPRGAGPDDLLDAFACAVAARRIARGEARRFPDNPERDAHGLPMVIHA
ncbi:DUF429 domain-containing protein [Alsobacter sp. SYSU M60028]|uniref:DUF429 domain-containing protein n=1 Tax=Alsobacter ponti TaxID=2962936 RepID=A0ABT1LB75_9HYPH|nr:DUF429 domain-containing protein [Alsobacter ponti]MCP8938679.1 DUF429 domain-containing protein [Alsobacter ponti]